MSMDNPSLCMSFWYCEPLGMHFFGWKSFAYTFLIIIYKEGNTLRNKLAEGNKRRLRWVRKREGGLLRFSFVWGEKRRKRDGRIMEVMREYDKQMNGRWKKAIGVIRTLRSAGIFEVLRMARSDDKLHAFQAMKATKNLGRKCHNHHRTYHNPHKAVSFLSNP